MAGTIITTFLQEEVKGECDASLKWEHQLRKKIYPSSMIFFGVLNSIARVKMKVFCQRTNPYFPKAHLVKV